VARLSYGRYGVQGGDWGSLVSQNMADLAPDRVAGLHVNFVTVPRPRSERADELDPEERASLERTRAFQEAGAGYSAIQGTRPQTLGYALDDSPTGLAAWIVEKFRAWSDCGGDVERSFSKDQLLTTTGTLGASAAVPSVH
jgi:microsomal epoxide hydrolase